MNLHNPQTDNALKFEIPPDDESRIVQLIEAILLESPHLKNKLTVYVVYQYIQLPDRCFGWPSENGPMPVPIKDLLIIRTLKLGLTPGMGELIWLGNSPFITAAARAFLVNQSHCVKATGNQKFRPFTPEEKTIFGVKEGDFNCAVEQLHTVDGIELEWLGHGLIGADELNTIDRNGQKKIGLRALNQIAQTLKTRAIADMNRRNFPVYGLQDTSDVPDYFGANVISIESKVPTAEEAERAIEKLIGTPKPPVEDKAKGAARYRFSTLAIQVKKRDGHIDKIVGEDTATILNDGTAERIHDAADVLESWLEVADEPAPTPANTETITASPPPPPPADKLTPRKAGRPSKAQSRFRKAETRVVELGGEPDKILSLNSYNLYSANDADALNKAAELLEQWIDDSDTPPPPRPIVGASKVDESNADEEREPWDNGEPPADPLADSENMSDEVWKAKFPYNSDEEDESEAEELTLEIDPDLQAELKTDRKIFTGTDEENEIVRAAADNAGLTSESLKHALLTVMRNRPMVELEANIKFLVDKVLAEKPAPAEPSIEPVNTDEPMKIPTSGQGAAAYAMLNKNLYDSKISAEVRAKIVKLISRKLKDGDHLYLPKAIREAKNGSYKELDHLINTRESRV